MGTTPREQIIREENGDVVAFVPHNMPRNEYEANARLIATAPELLAALQTVVSNILDYERVNNFAPSLGRKYCWDSVARASEIIAKATGVTLTTPHSDP